MLGFQDGSPSFRYPPSLWNGVRSKSLRGELVAAGFHSTSSVPATATQLFASIRTFVGTQWIGSRSWGGRLVLGDSDPDPLTSLSLGGKGSTRASLPYLCMLTGSPRHCAGRTDRRLLHLAPVTVGAADGSPRKVRQRCHRTPWKVYAYAAQSTCAAVRRSRSQSGSLGHVWVTKAPQLNVRRLLSLNCFSRAGLGVLRLHRLPTSCLSAICPP
jgi:hypothetical protein